jgi:hypothetical protein
MSRAKLKLLAEAGEIPGKFEGGNWKVNKAELMGFLGVGQPQV